MGKIRQFEADDIPEVLELCNQNMEYDSLSEVLFKEKVLEDPSYDPHLIMVFEEDGQIVGFIDGVTREINEERTGYVKLMVVKKEYRRRGIGHQLYEELEIKLKARGMEKVRVYDTPFNYFMPGIDPRYTPAIAFFEVHGFRRFADTSNMTVDLENQTFDTQELEEKLKKQGVSIRRAEYDDRDVLLDFIAEHFPLWRYEVLNAYNSIPIAIHLAFHHGRLMAFSAHNGNNFGTGWFGPMGTHPELRGMGIGGILLKRCLNDMKEWGLKRSTIPWVGPIRFYSYHVNAVVERVFWRYEKELGQIP